ncbi:hypothetical protein QPK87_11040 [Kamptonema cortianum]|nr:hypothetical protein [Geitlerinema splendidum]MDK3157110.1 hypothetical protein [Kamptonema cortianum]
MTRADALSAFANLIAVAAVRCASDLEKPWDIEPEINQNNVDKETSVKDRNIELCLMTSLSQPSLFGEDES